MIRLVHASACALALLLAAGLHAQSAPRECPGGREADESGIQISVSLLAHPTRVANTVDSLLRADGYEVLRSPAAAGRWQIAPRFTYLEKVKDEAWARGPHPGVQLGVVTEETGDSTKVEIGAWMLCQPQGADEEVRVMESALELLTAGSLAADLTGALDTLEAAGVDLAAAVERPGLSLPVAQQVGEFRLVNQEDYDDPRLGTGLRYAREDGFYLDVYVYPGIAPGSACLPACAQARADEEVEAFVGQFPMLLERGYYARMDVAANDPVTPPAGVRWMGGRHLRMVVARAQAPQSPMHSDFVLYAFPGYMVKVRATYPPSDRNSETIREFVAALLAQLVP